MAYDKDFRYVNTFNKLKRIKHNSRYKLKYLFRHGNISNDDFICAICGDQPVDKHHENYDLPFVFIPLCKRHHKMLNRYSIRPKVLYDISSFWQFR